MSRIPPASSRLTCGTLKTRFTGTSTYFFSSQLKHNLSLDASLKMCAKSLPWAFNVSSKRVYKAQLCLLPMVTQLRFRRNVNFQHSLSQLFFVNKLNFNFGPRVNMTQNMLTSSAYDFQMLPSNDSDSNDLAREQEIQVSTHFKNVLEHKSSLHFLNTPAECVLSKSHRKHKAKIANLNRTLSFDARHSFEFETFGFAEENSVLFFLFCSDLIFAKIKAKSNLWVHKLKSKFKYDQPRSDFSSRDIVKACSQLEVIRFKDETMFVGKPTQKSMVYTTLKPRQVQTESHQRFKFTLNRSFNKSSNLNLFSFLPFQCEFGLTQSVLSKKNRPKAASARSNIAYKKALFCVFS